MSLHIGFDISQTGSAKAGCGFYAHALAQALPEIGTQHRFALYPDFGDFFFDARMPLRNPIASPATSYGPRHLSRELAASFWNAPDLELALGQPDVVHSNNFWCPVQLRQSRLVYTFYDMGFVIEPSWTTETNRIGCFDGVFRAALAADWIVSISAASRRHFLEVFPHFPADRVRVIHPCSRFADTTLQGRPPRSLARLDGPFWLCVGTLEPRKNQFMLARAYAAYLARGGRPIPLVFAGGDGWHMEDFPAQLEKLGLSSRVVRTGYVTDDELVWLYRNCYANLYPSLFEGFGLPVLEGMQFGAPTLCASGSSLPEVAGDGAQMIDAHDEQAWADALLALGANQEARSALAARCLAQAATFNWRSSASQLLALYEEASASPRRTQACHVH